MFLKEYVCPSAILSVCLCVAVWGGVNVCIVSVPHKTRHRVSASNSFSHILSTETRFKPSRICLLQH